MYGGGGAAASTWSRDYVELYNPTDQAVDLAGTSVQYRSATGTANPSGVTALSGSIPAKGYFLVGEGTGTTGAPVPSPAVSGSIQLSGTAGTVFLANQATALTAPPTGSLTGNPAVLDLVGYGTSNTFEKAPDAGHLGVDGCRNARGGHRHRRQLHRLQDERRVTGRRTCGRTHRPAGRPAHDPDHRGDPGHRRHQPVRRQGGHHRGRGDGGVPDRRVQRLLPPDRRHRR